MLSDLFAQGYGLLPQFLKARAVAAALLLLLPPALFVLFVGLLLPRWRCRRGVHLRHHPACHHDRLMKRNTQPAAAPLRSVVFSLPSVFSVTCTGDLFNVSAKDGRLANDP